VGFFANSYGNLSRYGSGLYSNPILGSPFGVGETLTLEYDVSESVTAIVEHGIMGDRVGKAPDGVVASSATRAENPAFPAAFTHHAHAGIIVSGDAQFKLQAHYLRNWAQDDSDQERNNSQTRYFVESDVRDGRINVFGFDAAVDHATFGYLGVGFSLIDAKNAFPLRGFNTYAGEGVRLTDSWLGFPTVGTGTVVVGAMNYSVSLGRVANYPRPFPGDHADVQLDTSIHVTRTATDYPDFDGRWRYKGALALNYRFLPFMGASGRWDAVVPNSKDSEETFHVLMPTLYFRTDWNSRETISLIYARWFFGERSRRDGSLTKASRLDDTMFALNFTMWW
jgi:hypothetical protein